MHSSDDRFTRFLLQMIRFGRFLYRFFEALAGTGHCGASHQVALAWHWALSASLQAGTGHCGAGYKCNTAVPSLALSATWATRRGVRLQICVWCVVRYGQGS